MVEVVEEEVLLMTSMVGVDRRLLMAAMKTAASSSPLLSVALSSFVCPWMALLLPFFFVLLLPVSFSLPYVNWNWPPFIDARFLYL